MICADGLNGHHIIPGPFRLERQLLLRASQQALEVLHLRSHLETAMLLRTISNNLLCPLASRNSSNSNKQLLQQADSALGIAQLVRITIITIHSNNQVRLEDSALEG
jgi:hypothetical protein